MIMKCGCTPISSDREGNRFCGVHRCYEQLNPQPDLTNRMAVCCWGDHKHTPSSPTLPWFRYSFVGRVDNYDCGCRGFD